MARFVEAKSFISGSLTRDLALAVGQSLIYRALLEKSEPDREVWLALPREVYDDYFCREAVQWIVARYDLKILTINVSNEEVDQWIS